MYSPSPKKKKRRGGIFLLFFLREKASLLFPLFRCCCCSPPLHNIQYYHKKNLKDSLTYLTLFVGPGNMTMREGGRKNCIAFSAHVVRERQCHSLCVSHCHLCTFPVCVVSAPLSCFILHSAYPLPCSSPSLSVLASCVAGLFGGDGKDREQMGPPLVEGTFASQLCFVCYFRPIFVLLCCCFLLFCFVFWQPNLL